jgi:U3 small nucleolar RNA-associated protein 18
VNDNVNAIAFSPDSKYLFTYGDAKDVHIFDLASRSHECLHRFNDYGCLSGKSIAITNNMQYLATGDKSGVINVYNYDDVTKNANPKPVKSFMNLTTPCTSLKFNCTGEILAACSSFSENACKLASDLYRSYFSATNRIGSV